MKRKDLLLLLIALVLLFLASCGRQSGQSTAVQSGGISDTAMQKAADAKAQLREAEKHSEETVDLEILYDGDIFGANVVGYSGEGDRAWITCNDDYFCYAVTSVGESAFEDCATLRTVVFVENDIEEIGARAFRNCSALKEFTVPFKTETIGERAFENCESLSSLRILGCTEIGEYAFAGCTALTEVTIPPDTKLICAHAFDGCTALETVTLRGEDTVIENGAFDNCPKLKADVS